MLRRSAVCICPDAKWLIPALFVAAQARHHAGSEHYDVIVFAPPDSIAPRHREWIDEQDIILQPARALPDTLRRVRSRNRRWSRATLYRLVVPEQIAGHYDRILYLDCDVTIEAPIAPLFSLDLAEHGIAAIRDLPIYFKTLEGRTNTTRNLNLADPTRYFNAGILLIDVERWLRDEIGQHAREYLKAHPGAGLLDQAALNKVVDGRFSDLSPRWNLPMRGYRPLHLGDFIEPAIRHFTGHPKPWMRFADEKPKLGPDDDYWLYHRFLQTTPWRGWLSRQWGVLDLYRNIRFELVRRYMGRRPPHELSAAKRESRREAFFRYCTETHFIDIAQGITPPMERPATLEAPHQPAAGPFVPAFSGADPIE